MIKKLDNKKKIVIGLSLCLLVISLTQPAFSTSKDAADALNQSSIGIFFLGWMGFLTGAIESFFWFANPLYILALILYVKNKSNAFWFSVAASILALSFTLLNTFFANEGGGRSTITGYGMGYILWVSSLFLLTLGILITQSRKPKLVIDSAIK